jgi:hypothetical protein
MSTPPSGPPAGGRPGPPTARETFVRSMRPARLFLYLHRLLEDDERPTPEELVKLVSGHLEVGEGEALKQIRNAAFLGFIRPGESGSIDLSRPERDNLLRQACVVCCSATETFLTNELLNNLPEVVDLCGMNFLDAGDDELLNDLSGLLKSFKTKDVLGYLARPPAARAKWLGGRILDLIKDSYLKGDKDVRMVGRLLGVADPWGEIARRLPELDDPDTCFVEVAKRRKEIVHRGDFSRVTGSLSDIDTETVEEWVEVTERVCLCLDDLITERLEALRLAAREGRTDEEED